MAALEYTLSWPGGSQTFVIVDAYPVGDLPSHEWPLDIALDATTVDDYPGLLLALADGTVEFSASLTSEAPVFSDGAFVIDQVQLFDSPAGSSMGNPRRTFQRGR